MTPVRMEECPMVKALEAIGERWTLLVLREAMYGVSRFEEMREHLGIARNILTKRLAALVDRGILSRAEYREPGRRARFEYKLTDKGWSLLPALMALAQWYEQHHPTREGRALAFRHRKSGEEARVDFVRSGGKRVERLSDLAPVFWPDRKKNRR